MPSGIREEHKSRWLLQIAPRTFLKSNAFGGLTRRLHDTPGEYLSSQIEMEKDAITTLLNGHELFCVLDGVQVPTELAPKHFRSEHTPGAFDSGGDQHAYMVQYLPS